jgi:hypothetical protein
MREHLRGVMSSSVFKETQARILKLYIQTQLNISSKGMNFHLH